MQGAPGRLRGIRALVLLYLVGLIAFGMVAGSRLWRQSSDPHFVLLADAWLHGELAIDPGTNPTPKGDDWAFVDTYERRGGGQVRGRRMITERSFLTTEGEKVPLTELGRRVARTFYVSFPPAPALLMIPSAALSGSAGNDVIPSVLVAALALPLAFLTLRRLRMAVFAEGPHGDHTALWLALGFGFGTVFFVAAVQGRVWFTAHVIGVVLTWGYLFAATEARRPIVSGLLLGLAATTRTPLAFAFPYFAFEAWRVAGGWRPFIRLCVRFAAPVVLLAALAIAYNLARWDAATEFGHSYLHVRQQANIEVHGLLSTHYLARNLKVAFALLPELSGTAPFIRMSGHGMALWITTPIVLWVLWIRRRTPLHVPLWLTTALVLTPALLYQNSGWFQFGYRFGLDSLPFLFALVAIGPPLQRIGHGLIMWGVVVNLFGALTFGRDMRFYKVDRATYHALE